MILRGIVRNPNSSHAFFTCILWREKSHELSTQTHHDQCENHLFWSRCFFLLSLLTISDKLLKTSSITYVISSYTYPFLSEWGHIMSWIAESFQNYAASDVPFEKDICVRNTGKCTLLEILEKFCKFLPNIIYSIQYNFEIQRFSLRLLLCK